MMIPSKIYLDRLKGPSGKEIIGDVSFSYRMRIVQLFWKPDGLMVGSESTALSMRTATDCIICHPGSIVPWSKLLGSWTLGFLEGEAFATGSTLTIETLDEWIHYVPLLHDNVVLPCFESLLVKSSYDSPLSWPQILAASNQFDSQVRRFKMPSASADPIRNTIRFYSISAVLQEMAQASPDPGIIAWIRDAFCDNE